MGILIFKGLTARRIYKSFGVKGLNSICTISSQKLWYMLLGTELAFLFPFLFRKRRVLGGASRSYL
jgi:hypothetical protein